jgi:ParB family transcriptional regulator, chromosome partitioning protein
MSADNPLNGDQYLPGAQALPGEHAPQGAEAMASTDGVGEPAPSANAMAGLEAGFSGLLPDVPSEAEAPAEPAADAPFLPTEPPAAVSAEALDRPLLAGSVVLSEHLRQATELPEPPRGESGLPEAPLAEHRPAEHGLVEHGLVEHGPDEHGPDEHSLEEPSPAEAAGADRPPGTDALAERSLEEQSLAEHSHAWARAAAPDASEGSPAEPSLTEADREEASPVEPGLAAASVAEAAPAEHGTQEPSAEPMSPREATLAQAALSLRLLPVAGADEAPDGAPDASPEPGGEARGVELAGGAGQPESVAAPTDQMAAGEEGGVGGDGLPGDGPAEVGLRRRAQVAPALIALDRIDEDTSFQVRPEGDVSLLATDVARVGQLFPVDVRLKGPDRFQVVCGFRRVAALRFLHREFVLARVHTDLGDEDALLMALAAAIHATPVSPAELEAVRERLEDERRLSAATRDMLEKALQPDEELAPEGVEVEVDADELAADVAQRLGAINQDLALLADVFTSLDESRRAELLMQLRYSAELVAYLEGLS